MGFHTFGAPASILRERPTLEDVLHPVARQTASSGAVGDADPVQTPPLQPNEINPTGRNVPLGGPLIDNGFVIGQIDYLLRTDGEIEFEAAQFLGLVLPRLNTESGQSVAQNLTGKPTVTASELRALGVPISYNPQTFAIELTIAVAQRPRQEISVSGAPPLAISEITPPAGLSGYVTILGNLDYVHRGFDTGLQNPNILVDSAVRFNDFVLENEATIQDDFRRENTRLVYDDLRRSMRFAGGDLRPVSRGFSGASPIAGISAERIYADLDPQRNIQPRGQRSFTITQTSTVETFVNGVSVQQTRLQPGTYDIGDFPFAQGANDVRLVVRADDGRESVVSFSIAFDRNLLAKGLSEFGVYAGVATPFDGRGRDYTSSPAASGFYRRGISETVTAGGNFQVGERGGVAGAEVVWASPIGTLGFDLAASNVDGVGTGYALNLGLERDFGTASSHRRSLVATYQYVSEDFANADARTAVNLFSHEFGATFSMGISRDHYVSADGFYSVGRSRPDQYTARTTYGWRINTRMLFTAEASYQDRGFNREYGVRAALTMRFGTRSTATAEIDTRREGGRLSYQTSSGRGVGSFNAQATVEYFDQQLAGNGNITALLNRAEVGAAHSTSYSTDTRSIVDQRTSLRLGTSIAFADGEIALSRPIFNSFAIFAPHRTLNDAPVYLQPDGDDYTARSGALGGAVASDLSSYTPQLFTYDVPDAPLGYDLGAGLAAIVPPYRSGYIIDVGSDYSITFVGALLKPNGEPLTLTSALVYEVDAPDRPPVQAFTNRFGKFVAMGLRPGRWRAEAGFGDRLQTYVFEIPAAAEGLVRSEPLLPGNEE
ncbi:hypothetical protein [Qipengyuania qiaonensis]|uniref:Fimbrial biogenesis outer membrane usher protein n=1 Tax=Qipengyuania qiaonensis TaxID=2867240 RepID=A0ABS7JC67_9SPHN|nr:hypothetical protein [Qipengyuania qiaonensis]MBX7483434.1 hypothetical protein [Qipengyuania qiaonensis]